MVERVEDYMSSEGYDNLTPDQRVAVDQITNMINEFWAVAQKLTVDAGINLEMNVKLSVAVPANEPEEADHETRH